MHARCWKVLVSRVCWLWPVQFGDHAGRVPVRLPICQICLGGCGGRGGCGGGGAVSAEGEAARAAAEEEVAQGAASHAFESQPAS